MGGNGQGTWSQKIRTGSSGGKDRDSFGKEIFTFNAPKPKTGQIKIIKGRKHELHPTKGWQKVRSYQEGEPNG
jgi:hypothetical protein